MDGSITIATLFILLLVFVSNAIVRRHEATPMRSIGAFDIVKRIAGASIEKNQPLHVSTGSSGLGDDTTILTLVGKEFIYYLTREVAIGDAAPIFTTSNTAVVSIGMDTLRRAYFAENLLERFKPVNVRWYPSGSRSLAFASALIAMQSDDKISGNVLTGRFGAELALILDATYRHRKLTIAGSDQLDGQAIAYAMADEALIGEEIFAAPGYLSQDLRLINRNVVLDRLRTILVVTIIALTLVSTYANLSSGS